MNHDCHGDCDSLVSKWSVCLSVSQQEANCKVLCIKPPFKIQPCVSFNKILIFIFRYEMETGTDLHFMKKKKFFPVKHLQTTVASLKSSSFLFLLTNYASQHQQLMISGKMSICRPEWIRHSPHSQACACAPLAVFSQHMELLVTATILQRTVGSFNHLLPVFAM